MIRTERNGFERGLEVMQFMTKVQKVKHPDYGNMFDLRSLTIFPMISTFCYFSINMSNKKKSFGTSENLLPTSRQPPMAVCQSSAQSNQSQQT